MSKLTLDTGLYTDAEIIIKAADAPVIDLKKELSDEEWDQVLDDILDADLIITA
ncbi:hypothetical protein RYZ26_18765 [Terasakiella sp. A23]|uniref:hypothetical protein n=1 Tax=Terasakiella sp. FCG-A23 TaxID=3080561 RepID=UPI002952C770|nr:hypothetical protein [Terasakiella sp. A23]MDV7341650.1 hypothetical protein [Terasakiella sp. A23]